MFGKRPSFRNPWAWVPTLYYAQGIPYVVVMLVSVIMYKRMGISNADIAFYTSLLYLPWAIKPLWSPFVDIFKTKRLWIVIMQFIVGLGLAGVAFTIPLPNFLQYTLAFFLLLAFSSATHDIAADGFYMLGLSEHDQAFFVGIRSTFYRLSMITGQGLLIILAGYFETHSGLPPAVIDVTVNPEVKTEQVFLPDSISNFSAEGELKVVANSSSVTLNTKKRSKSEVDSIVHLVQIKNIQNGFYNTKDGQPKLPILKINPADYSKLVGNISIISFALSSQPEAGQDYVVNFDRDGGDKSIAILEGTRFLFNKANWNKPALVVIQVDPKLKTETSAVFKAISGNIPWAWSMTFLILVGLFILFFIYHYFILPYPVKDGPAVKDASVSVGREFIRTFALFFKKKEILLIITFLLIYRFGEAQLVKLASPFLLDPREVGGLGLTTGEVGFVYGTVGIIALTLGGLTGGFLAARDGLKKWIWWMFAAINIPHILYIYLAFAQPENFVIINLCVAGEQFGYGFGFTAYMLYMIYVSEGEFKTSHYAICTGFMALSMMIPGIFAGMIQEALGYPNFFIWILLTMIPGFFITRMLKIDPEFGKKKIEAK
ncbi:MAG: MFS transporter [Ignavibacteriaceae bacterium]|nr:MFS transporter [Ignavibacteriaceae bacterium]